MGESGGGGVLIYSAGYLVNDGDVSGVIVGNPGLSGYISSSPQLHEISTQIQPSSLFPLNPQGEGVNTVSLIEQRGFKGRPRRRKEKRKST